MSYGTVWLWAVALVMAFWLGVVLAGKALIG